MCGVFGVLGISSTSQCASVVSQALHLQAHRGPDGRAVWTGEHCGLGHARLAVVDVRGSCAAQPMQAEQCVAVVNGEIYQHKLLRAELESQGCVFKSESDSEVALHLYLRYGPAFVSRLRGEFALLIWDSQRKTLIAVRDRFGIKPLFYTVLSCGIVAFASEAKAFAALPDWQPRWDALAMLQNGWAADCRTCFAGVSKLPPGHMAHATATSLHVTPYWDFSFPMKTLPDTRALEEMVLETRRLLVESVTLRLQADVPVGVYLSGGIDSATCLGIAASMLREQGAPRAKAFSISFVDDPNFDEGPIAERMASFADAEFYKMPVTEEDLIANFEDAVYHGEIPLFNFNCVAKFMLSRFARSHDIKVVLTGEGSDEIFGGYSVFLRDFLREPDPSFTDPLFSDALRHAKFIETQMSMSTSGTHTQTVYATFQRTWDHERAAPLLGGIDAHSSLQLFSLPARVFSDSSSAESGGLACATAISGVARERMLSSWHPLHSALYVWSKSLLDNVLLNVLGDRMEMAHSLEGRLPFLDHKVVEYVSHLPPSVKIRSHPERGLVEKWILREAAKPFITDELYARMKHGFLSPLSVGDASTPFGQYVKRKITPQSLSRVPFLNAKAILSAIEDRTLNKFQLILLLSVVVLQERYNLK